MRIAGKYILTGVLFLRVLLATDMPVAGPVPSFNAYMSFSDFYSSDGGHKLARSASGKLHAVLADVQNNRYKIIRAYSDNNGVNFTTAVITENNTGTGGAFLRNPSLAVFGEDVYVVYAEANNANTDRGIISIVKYTGDGAAQQSARITTDVTNNFVYTDIALDKEGYIYVATTFTVPGNQKIFLVLRKKNAMAETLIQCAPISLS